MVLFNLNIHVIQFWQNFFNVFIIKFISFMITSSLSPFSHLGLFCSTLNFIFQLIYYFSLCCFSCNFQELSKNFLYLFIISFYFLIISFYLSEDTNFLNISVCLFFLRFYLFLERGREGDREGEKHQCVVASGAPLLGAWPTAQACALTGNATLWFAGWHSTH